MKPEQKNLVEKNLALARFLARLVWSKNPNEMDLEELTSVAYQGLVTSAIRWNPVGREFRDGDLENGKAFSGFARQRILGAIYDWQRSVDHVQRSYRGIYKLLRASGHGQGATDEELSISTGIPILKLRQVIRAVEGSPISLDGLMEHWSEEPVGHMQDTKTVESSALETIIKTAVSEAYADLTELQQVVLALRYYSGVELQVISSDLGLGLTVIREAHSAGVLYLHAAMLSKVKDSA